MNKKVDQISGFLFLDKEKGDSSFRALKKVRRVLLSINPEYKNLKIGHAGTLDPIATGLLVVALGEATKLLEFLSLDSKAYEATAFLGATSDTFDECGKIEITSKVSAPTLSLIKKVVQQKFVGKVKQMPPKFSAKKVKGVRAYKLAISGQQFDLKPVDIEIFDFKILKYKFPELKFFVKSSSGVYIRSIISDLGDELSTGAYMRDLRRVSSGKFNLKLVIKPEDFSIEKIIPAEDIFVDFPSIEVSKSEYLELINGQFINNVFALSKKSVHDGVFLAKYKGKIFGVCEFAKTESEIKIRKKFNIVL